MLDVTGAPSVATLFAPVPERVRFPELDLPHALTEMEADDQLGHFASRTQRRRPKTSTWAPARTGTSFPRPSVRSWPAASSTPPTRRTSRKWRRARCKSSTSFRAW